MATETIRAGQLILDSTTPPPDRGFYKIDDFTTGHVGKLVINDPTTNAASTVVTATSSAQGIAFSTGAVDMILARSVRVPVLPSVYASLVSGATYGQSGTLVTVAATAHGIPAACNGMRFYWPGSAAVPSDWYSNLQIVDANTLTFDNPTSQTVAPGAASTASLPFSTAATLPESIVFLAGDLFAGAQITADPVRWGDSTAASKWFRMTLGGAPVSAANMVSLGGGIKQSATVLIRSLTKQLGFAGADGVGGSSRYETSINVANQVTLGFALYFGAATAGQYQVIESIYVTLK